MAESTARREIVEILRHLHQLTKWLAIRLWDWAAVLFIVGGLWTFGALVIGAALAVQVPFAMEIAGGWSLLILGGLILAARIIHAAWMSGELNSIFQRIVITGFVIGVFCVLGVVSHQYLFGKVPLLRLEDRELMPSSALPPEIADQPAQAPSQATDRGPRSYVEFDGNPMFVGRAQNGAEGFPYQVGDPLGFNVHYKSTGPNQVTLLGGYMATMSASGVFPDASLIYHQAPIDQAVKLFFAESAKEQRERKVIPPAHTLMPGDAEFGTAFRWTDDYKNYHRVIQNDLDAVQSGAETWIVISVLTYSDGSAVHHLRRCLFLLPPSAPPGIWHNCGGIFPDSD